MRKRRYILASAMAGILVVVMATPALAASVSASVEQDQVSRINTRRSGAGRNALTRSGCITSIARQWSIKMAQAGGISHNPNLGSQLTNTCNGAYTAAGENVGRGPSSVILWDAFVASAPHRANIDGSWHFVGVGSYTDDGGTVWITHVFVRCSGCGSPWTSGPSDSGLTDKRVVGDWNGDGISTPGFVRGNVWYLDNQHSGPGAGVPDQIVAYGKSTDVMIAGDWNGDGIWTPGVVRGNTWLLTNNFDSDNGDPGDVPTFAYGTSTDVKIAGDWNGNGTFTPGVVRGNLWFLNNGFDSSNGDAGDVPTFGYGTAADKKIVGDWDGNRSYTPGVVQGNIFHLNNGFDGAVDIVPFPYGKATDVPVVGDWDNDSKSTTTPGVVRILTWFLSNGFTGTTNVVVEY